ncbi:MAG: enolase C-terminal domain-like protein [Bdellovibrionota bacterium]
MGERLWISPYFLTPVSKLGARALAGDRYGVLIRADLGGVSGFADLHPWPELGDYSVAEELKALAEGRPLRLGQRSLYFARRDREARDQRKNLFDGLEIPVSHRLIPDLASVTNQDLVYWRNEGFTHLKIKVGRDPIEELRRLKSLAPSLAGYRLRFDFNEIGTVEAVSEWIRALEGSVRSAIEFLEDPIAYQPMNWVRVAQETKLPLALDRQSTPDTPSDWLVIKPATQSSASFVATKSRVCVTSSLDHPVGQLAAALEAAELARDREVGICGLLSQSAYEPNDFSRALRVEGPRLLPPTGDFGFGFTSLFEKADWRPLES